MFAGGLFSSARIWLCLRFANSFLLGMVFLFVQVADCSYCQLSICPVLAAHSVHKHYSGRVQRVFVHDAGSREGWEEGIDTSYCDALWIFIVKLAALPNKSTECFCFRTSIEPTCMFLNLFENGSRDVDVALTLLSLCL